MDKHQENEYLELELAKKRNRTQAFVEFDIPMDENHAAWIRNRNPSQTPSQYTPEMLQHRLDRVRGNGWLNSGIPVNLSHQQDLQEQAKVNKGDGNFLPGLVSSNSLGRGVCDTDEELSLNRNRYLQRGYTDHEIPVSASHKARLGNNGNLYGLVLDANGSGDVDMDMGIAHEEHESTILPVPTSNQPVSLPDNPRIVEVFSVRSQKWLFMEVFQDSGTTCNWVSPKVAAKLGLAVTQEKRSIFTDFCGEKFAVNRHIQIPWRGKRTDGGHEVTKFYIGPEGFPVDLVVGLPFLQEMGTNQFMEPGGKMLINVQAKPSQDEIQLSTALGQHVSSQSQDLIGRSSREKREKRDKGDKKKRSGSSNVKRKPEHAS